MPQLNYKGFTLLETLIVIVIFAIGAAIAIPSIVEMGKRGSVRSDVRQLKDQIARARLLAIERNQNVVVVFNQDGDATTNDYIIFEDRNNNDIYNDSGANPDVLITGETLQADINATGLSNNTEAKDHLVWNTRGTPDSFGAGTQRVIVSSNGRSFDIAVTMMGSVRIDE